MAVVAVVIVLAVAGVVGALLESPPDEDAGSSAPAGSQRHFRAEAKRFYADVRTSLVPLLRHAERLRAALRRAESEPASPQLAVLAHGWAEDMATARDLVGRLVPPARPDSLRVRTVYELGTMVYGESARSLERLSGLTDRGARTEAAISGLRLYLLADRLFDQAKRLLDLHGDLESDPLVTLRLPAEVPDFEKEGLSPGGPSQGVPEGSGFAEGNPETVSATRWRDDHDDRLASAARILSRTTNSRTAIVAREQLRNWSEELQAASRELAGPVPKALGAREASFLLRLALLVESESLGVLSMAASADDPAFAQAQRLRLIGDLLWRLGRDLLAGDGARLPPSYDFPETGIDPGILRRGGMFDGHPPPLAPGDPPDAGVPGGLRVPDPSEIFTGP